MCNTANILNGFRCISSVISLNLCNMLAFDVRLALSTAAIFETFPSLFAQSIILISSDNMAEKNRKSGQSRRYNNCAVNEMKSALFYNPF